MDVLHLYGISPAFLDVAFSLHTLGFVVVAGLLIGFCTDMIKEKPHVILVILGVSLIWYIPVYKLVKFVIKDGIETRKARKASRDTY